MRVGGVLWNPSFAWSSSGERLLGSSPRLANPASVGAQIVAFANAASSSPPRKHLTDHDERHRDPATKGEAVAALKVPDSLL